MGQFAYIAKSRTGDEVTGFLAGNTVDEVVNHLHGQGLVVLHVRPDREGRPSRSWRERLAGLTTGSVGVRDLALFTRQLATVLEAGIPLVRGLYGLAADATSRVLSRAVHDIALRIERGEALSDALAVHREAFHTMYISMVRAGERAGTLDAILEQLAVYLEKVDAIRTKVRSALAYPVFILVFALLATGFLLFKIVPTFAEIYGDLGQALPGLTLLIVSLSDAARSHVLLTILLLAALVLFLVVVTRSGPGRYAWDGFLLRMPVFGPIIRRAVMSRFARTFGILLRSGLPLLEALDLVRDAVGNAVVGRAIEQAQQRIAQGHGITASFRETRKMPEMVLQLMSTGEESGEMDSMLVKASDFYDRQVEASVQGLTALIEPVLIVLVGALIGVVVVAMFLPIFYLGEAVMRGGYSL